MKYFLVPAAVLFAMVAANPQASPNETAVRNILREEIAAWNAGDAVAYARHFGEDARSRASEDNSSPGVRLSLRGMTTSSRGHTGGTLKQDIVSLKLIRPDPP